MKPFVGRGHVPAGAGTFPVIAMNPFVGWGHVPTGAGTTNCVQTRLSVPSAAYAVGGGTLASAACGGESEQEGVAESRRLILKTD